MALESKDEAWNRAPPIFLQFQDIFDRKIMGSLCQQKCPPPLKKRPLAHGLYWTFRPIRCAMFWNLWKKISSIFAFFIFWDVIDFVLKILRKLTKISPYMTNYWILFRFCSRLAQNTFQKILRKWKKSFAEFFFLSIIFF